MFRIQHCMEMCIISFNTVCQGETGPTFNRY